MEQRLTFLTLGVENLEIAVDFYENKLDWKRSSMSNEHLIIFKLNDLNLALYSKSNLAKDATVNSQGSGFKGFTISHNLNSEQEVNSLIEKLRKKGVKILKEPQKVYWGGYSSYIVDPDQNLIEIAYNPFLEND